MQEWARHKIGTDISTLAEEELEAVRQAANILCLFQKSDLAQDEFRETVCPLLRPKHIWLLLQTYIPDQFDSTQIPTSLLAQLKQKEENYKATDKMFDLDYQIQPLKFDFEFVPQLNFESINVPKVVIDRPGFAFLKGSGTTSNMYVSNGNKW